MLPWWPPIPGGDAHAGHTETSLMLPSIPSWWPSTWPSPATRGPLAEIAADLRAEASAARANGVLGDPTGATTEEGATSSTRSSTTSSPSSRRHASTGDGTDPATMTPPT